MEEKELQAALKMSMAVEEEKKKLEQLEDEELQKAIRMSLEEQSQQENKPPYLSNKRNYS